MTNPVPRSAFVFIIMTLVIDAMGIGLLMPVLPGLITEISGGTLGDAAVWGAWLAGIFAFMQFLFAPLVGSLSDRYGRRPVLLVSMFVICVDFIIMGLAHSMWLLILTRIFGGIAASTQSTASAFIADISAPEDKAKNFGIVGAAFGVGFVLGPVIGGQLGEFGTRAPIFAAAALAGCNLILGLLVLPETVRPENRRPFSLARANPIGVLRALRKLQGMGRFLVLAFFYEFAFIVYPAVWAYYGYARFGWSEGMVGLSLGGFGISMAIVQGVLIRIIIPRVGEISTIVWGIMFNAVIFAILAFITSSTLTLLLTPIAAFGAVVTPALTGLMSRKADNNQQGELQGGLTSIRAIAAVTSPFVMALVFERAIAPSSPFYLPGAPFLVSLALMGLCLVIFWPVVRSRRGTSQID